MSTILDNETTFDKWFKESQIKVFVSDITSSESSRFSIEKSIIQWQGEGISDYLNLIDETQQKFIILSKDVFNIDDFFEEENYALMGEYLSDSDYLRFKQLYAKLNKLNGSLISLDISFPYNGFIFQHLSLSEELEIISEFNELVKLMENCEHQFKYKVEKDNYNNICNALSKDPTFVKGKNKSQRETIASDFINEKFPKENIASHRIRDISIEAYDKFQIRKIKQE